MSSKLYCSFCDCRVHPVITYEYVTWNGVDHIIRFVQCPNCGAELAEDADESDSEDDSDG